MKKLKITAIILALVLISFTGCRQKNEDGSLRLQTEIATQQTTEPPTKTQIKNELENTLDSIFDNADFKGTVLVTSENSVIYERSEGFANEELSLKNSRNTRFYIGSITKQFTAAAIMILEQQGLLSINDTIDRFFPDYTYGSEIKVEQLLNMTSGVANYLKTENNEDTIAKLKPNDKEHNKEVVLDHIFSSDLSFSPGEGFEYSNSGYILLGEIIEQVSGVGYEEFIQQNIFIPLNMADSSFTPDDNTAKGYETDGEKDWQIYPGVVEAAGGIISTVDDIQKWIRAFTMNEVVSADSLEKMTFNNGNDYGYGIMLSYIGYGHSGNVASYVSFMGFQKDGNYTAIALSNYALEDPVNLAQDMIINGVILDTSL